MISPDQDIVDSDYINESERDATPSNDSGRVPKLESDGKLDSYFTKNGFKPTAGETITGATLPVPVWQDKTNNKVKACDGNDLTKLKFLGFAISDSTDGSPIKVQTGGVVAGFSGLDEGEKYYLSDTAGAIANAPGTYEVLVGVAISPTELLIQKGRRRANGVATFSSTTTSAITTGFRPSAIRMTGYMVETGGNVYGGHAAGSWVNGVYASAYFNGNDGSPAATTGTTSSYILNLFGQGNEYFRVTITSVTDTGFTISCSEITDNSSLNLCWEAEGEL